MSTFPYPRPSPVLVDSLRPGALSLLQTRRSRDAVVEAL